MNVPIVRPFSFLHLSCTLMLCCTTLLDSRLCADVDYLKQIKPLLRGKCYSCHGVLKQEAGLRLETRSLMVKGGDSGSVIQPGSDAAASMILERVTAEEDLRMPPVGDGAALKKDEIALLKQWISEGAVAPEEDVPLAPTEHWAFLPIVRPPLTNTAANPIDELLAKERDARNFRTQPRADRSILIRRLYLDLVGLPPSLDQLHDERPWKVIVDELLASPQHGERWGRHWMDVWRYSDWYGLGAQLRNSQKHIWHWRDWIVNSLNADKGYDRMIMEMLAGDELSPDDPEVIAGTGFLARNYYLFNRTTWLDSTIEHTGKAFLGLTLNCAKCHDHKYDPITHVDYYSFRALFEPHQVRLDPIPGVTDFEKDGLPRVFDDQPDAKTVLHLRGNPKDPDPDTVIEPRVPALFASFQPQIKPVELPAAAYAPGVREYVRRDHLQLADDRITQATKQLAAAKKKLAAMSNEKPTSQKEKATDEAFLFTDDFEKPNPEAWQITGDAWKYANGTLLRETSTRNREYIRFRKTLPENFEVTCTYTHIGGATYKSVTFRFDESDDASYANFVYTSAHAPGPKVQVAYTRNKSDNYPANGRVARPIKIGEAYKLRFAVRDRLINVWLNDKFVLAYAYADRKPQGHFSFAGFDGTVAFDSIAIRSLPDTVELTEAGNAAAPTPADAGKAVEIAVAKLKAAELQKNSLQASIDADTAAFLNSDPDRAATAAKTATILQAEAALANAEVELLVAGEDSAKSKVANTKVEAARKKLAEAKNGSGKYAGIRASRKALEGPAHKEPDYAPTYSNVSTGRRLALAKWVTSPKNPLTARVAVNHVWMRHFGKPLVESVFDFGLRAKKPLHADVLDYLAAEFMESGWSFKHLHRIIVTSDAYQLASSTANADPATLNADADNQFYWRMNARRMESQVVRDCVLQLAGTLDLTSGGPSLDVGDKSKRRSIYFKHSRDQQDKFLTMFDDADLLQCYRRSESIVPQQALALANSKLAMSAASQIAVKIHESLPSADESTFAAVAFETLLGRTPSNDERSVCESFMNDLRAVLTDDESVKVEDLESRIRTRLIHSLLNHNDFISIR